MLKIINAHLRYKDQILFKNLNLEVAESEWVVLLGKSGVGKTSLLRMIGGLTQQFPLPDTELGGDIIWQGKQDLHSDVAYMAQQDGLFYWLSIIDNLLVPARLIGNQLDMQKAQHLVQQVGLANHAHKKPMMLSGGMRQRAALARTLMQEKAILLMDEPFSALDALTRVEMQGLLMQMLKPKKQMMIMVTHDPLEALRIADRILILSGVPADFVYSVNLPKTDVLRTITPELLTIYNEILSVLGQKS